MKLNSLLALDTVSPGSGHFHASKWKRSTNSSIENTALDKFVQANPLARLQLSVSRSPQEDGK